MADGKRITRRRFVALAGGSVVVVAGGAGVAQLLEDDAPRAEFELSRHVAGAFDDLDAAQAVGRAYKESNPSEAGEREIVTALRRSNPRWAQAGPRDALSLARDEARGDYAAGRVVGVDGWYLSRTEARLCALTTFV